VLLNGSAITDRIFAWDMSGELVGRGIVAASSNVTVTNVGGGSGNITIDAILPTLQNGANTTVGGSITAPYVNVVLPVQQPAISDLNQTISDPPTQAEVQAISDKVDEILAMLRAFPAIAT
jgi:hypothetical protein